MADDSIAVVALLYSLTSLFRSADIIFSEGMTLKYISLLHRLLEPEPYRVLKSLCAGAENEVLSSGEISMLAAIRKATEIAFPEKIPSDNGNTITPLRCIFDFVSLNDRDPSAVKSNYWSSLSIQRMPYPCSEQMLDSVRIRDELHQVCENMLRYVESTPFLTEDNLLFAMEKNISCISCFSQKATSDKSDSLSLFTISKLTAAIARCIYFCKTESSDSVSQPGEKFTLVGGDLSGIQKFIYTISSKNALKMVRARSFFVDLLLESMSVQLYRRLSLGRSNVVYSSGGGFTIIVPDKPEVPDMIKDFKEKANAFLYKHFGLSLYLCLNSIQVERGGLSGESGMLSSVLKQLRMKLNRQKSSKWEELILSRPLEFFEPSEASRECHICHSIGPDVEGNPAFEGRETCAFCEQMRLIGQKLPYIDSFYEHETGPMTDSLSLQIMDLSYSFDHIPDTDFIEYKVKNIWEEKQKPSGGNIGTIAFPVGNTTMLKEMSELAQSSIGDKKVGTLRMDIDHLGLIFGRGLPSMGIAALAELSNRINSFFKLYLPEIIGSCRSSFLPVPEKDITVNIIYAGGDDLFISGSWDSTIEAAWIVGSTFREYVAGNPDITISGGLSICDEKAAFYHQAEIAAKAEQSSKISGRNRLTIGNNRFTWQELENIKSNIFDMVFRKALERQGTRMVSNVFSKAFLNNFSYFIDCICDDSASSGKDGLIGGKSWIYPRLYYLFARNRYTKAAKTEDGKMFYLSLLNLSLNGVKVRYLPFVVQVVKLLTRGDTSDGDR